MFNVHNRDRIDPIIADTFDKASAESKRRFLKEHNNDGSHRFVAADLVPIGGMVDWPTTTPPEKWLVCDGSQVSRNTYQGLFNVLGTTFGAGDGSTTFNVPDLRQKFVLYKAASGTGASIGTTGGAIDHTHSFSVANHTHSISSVADHQHSVGSHVHDISSDGSHTHGGSTNATSNTIFFDRNLDATIELGVGDGHIHSFTTDSGGSHDHGGETDVNDAYLSGDGGAHDHGGATGSGGSASSNTGTNNPPFIVLNKIIFAGV